MARVLLLLPTATYRAADFLTAARALGAEVVVASERRLVSVGDSQVTLDLCRPEAAAEAIAAVAEERPLDAVVAVDDQGVRVAALAAERSGHWVVVTMAPTLNRIGRTTQGSRPTCR